MNIKELKEKYADHVKQAREIEETAKTDERELTDDEVQAIQGHLDDAELARQDIGQLETRAEVCDRLANAEATLEVEPERQTRPDSFTTNQYTHINIKDRAEDDSKHGFRNIGEFGQAVHDAGVAGNVPDNRLFIGQAAGTGMVQETGSRGGFAVPPEFSTTIWDGVRNSTGALLPMTDNYTVTGESLTMMGNAETSRAAGSRYGGIRGYWLAELEQMTSSYPKLRQVKIEPKELAVFAYVSDKLLANAPALNRYLVNAATDEINFMVNDAIINGTGAGQPLGILTADCTVEVSAETGQAADTIVPKNIVKMWSRMVARSRGNAVWLINQDIEPQLLTMTLDTGTAGLPVYMPPGGLSGSPYATLLGRAVIPVEQCATLGDAGDIILADLKGYLSGTKGGIDSAMSIHLKFDYNQTCFRWLFEADGQPWLASAITPFKGAANTQSTFIKLAARA